MAPPPRLPCSRGTVSGQELLCELREAPTDQPEGSIVVTLSHPRVTPPLRVNDLAQGPGVGLSGARGQSGTSADATAVGARYGASRALARRMAPLTPVQSGSIIAVCRKKTGLWGLR
jgi:hypothetical protein